MCSMIMNLGTLTAIAGCDFATFSVCPRKQNEKRLSFLHISSKKGMENIPKATVITF